MVHRSVQRNTAPTPRRVLLTVMSTWFLFSVTCFGLSPVYPDIARDLALTPATLGALLGLSTLTSALLQIPAGVFADHFGLRRFIVIGLVAAAAMALAVGAATTAAMFGASQVLLGVALPTLQAGSVTAVAHAYASGGRASAISYLWTSASVGMALSLLVFGIFSTVYGWRAVALGIAIAPLLGIPLVLRMPMVPDVAERTIGARARGIESLRFLKRPESMLIAAVSASSSLGGLGALFLLPFILSAASFSPAQIGILLLANVAGAVVGTPLIGRLSDSRGVARPLTIAFVVAASAMALLAFWSTNAFVVVVVLLLLGAATNGSQAVIQSVVADQAARVSVGTASALGGMRLAQFLGISVGPTLAGSLYLSFGGTIALLLLGTAFGFAALLSFAFLAGITGRPASPIAPQPISPAG